MLEFKNTESLYKTLLAVEVAPAEASRIAIALISLVGRSMIAYSSQIDLQWDLGDVDVAPAEAYRIASAIFAGVRVYRHAGSDRYLRRNPKWEELHSHPSLTAWERNK